MALQDQLTGSVPFSFEAEQSVLGAVIIDYSVLDTLIPLLRPEYFYMEQHRRIYETMLSMNLAAKPIDYVTLLDEVRAKGIFSERKASSICFPLRRSSRPLRMRRTTPGSLCRRPFCAR